METLDDGLETVSLSEVRPGDLIFTARPGRFQRLVELAGDPWRHVGVAAEVEGVLSICEVSGHRFQFRPLDRVAGTPHTAVGIVRLGGASDGCGAAAARWTVETLGRTNLYAWDDLMLMGVMLLVRRRTPVVLFDLVKALVREASELAAENPPPPGALSFTCSSFAYQAFVQAGPDCPPEIVIEPVRTRPARYRDETEPPPSLVDLLAGPIEGDVAAALERALRDHTILELSGVPPAPIGARVRSFETSHINADQFVAAVRNLISVFVGLDTTELPARLVMDGRWVTPGDLWRAPEVSLRALLPLAGGPPRPTTGE